MSIFQRDKDSKWQQRGPTISVVVGKAGLAWGRGIAETNSLPGPIKREGDNKAPAGIFRLSRVFGYASNADTKMPYRALSANTVAVDDPRSRYYNQLVDRSSVDNPDWRSAEKMFGVDVYKWGVVVEQNSPPRAGAGSCIFLHIWKTPATATSGCTAMSESDLLDVIRWLDPARRPLLVEVPQSSYEILRAKWKLPSLTK